MVVARLRWAAGACLAAALGLSQGQASAQRSQNWKWCVNENNAYSADLQINRCTALIHSGRDDPKFADAYYNRGNAYRKKGDLDRAMADYDEAIRLDPKPAYLYFTRGILYLFSGSLLKAQADFKQACELAPKNAYAALWLDLAERRNHIPSHLAEAAAQLDMKAWPAPVIRLYLGELTPAEVLAAADDSDPATKRRQVCQANFYSGELAPFDGSKQEAARLFRTAADGCPKDLAIF